jgi:hypothetical protein
MKSLTDKQAAFFGLVAESITPEVVSLDADGRRRMAEIVDTALQDRDEGVRKQFATFLGVIRWAPVARFGRPFDRLDTQRRDATLRWFQDCPVALLRQGFWGLKALVFMGYYGQPETREEIGYHPEFDGRAGIRRA